MADFEGAMWHGMLANFPTISIHGCLFHWAQALRRKLGELGLFRLYQRSSSSNLFCTKLMALPFLTSACIPGAFFELKRLCESHAGLTQFCSYSERQWIVSEFYHPARWSVFTKDMRTNNDLEGWHRRLNNHARRGQIQSSPHYPDSVHHSLENL